VAPWWNGGKMNFGFLLFQDLEELDFVGPWEIMNVWRMYANGPNCLTVSEKKGEINCAKGLKLIADYSFEDCPALDYLLIPGGKGRKQEMHNETLLNFVKKQSKNCRQVASVCTGAFILHSAGLLQNKLATTHWGSLEELRAIKDVSVEEKRFVRTGNVWTAAGVSAGIDMALAIIAEEAGEETAGQVQLYAEYYPDNKRYGTAHQNEKAPAYVKKS
jgi:transcriptional regulator GlxA family with amidase domain